MALLFYSTAAEIIRIRMPEEVPINTALTDLTRDLNLPLNDLKFPSEYRFQLLCSNPIYRQLFLVEARTGILRTAARIDRDKLCQRAELCCRMTPAHDSAELHGLKVVGFEAVQNKMRSSFSAGQHRLSVGLACQLEFRIAVNLQQDGSPASVDRPAPSSTTFAYVSIELMDLNDNVPQFIGLPTSQVSRNYDGQIMYVIKISESAAIGHQLPLPLAQDSDAGTYSVQGYRLEEPSIQSRGSQTQSIMRTAGGLPFHLISTRRDDGVILPKLELRESLDFETYKTYFTSLVAYDGDRIAPNSAEILVRIDVVDENDNEPTVTVRTASPNLDGTGQSVGSVLDPVTSTSGSHLIQVLEDCAVGTLLAQFEAHDADSGDNGRVIFAWSETTPPATQQLFELNPVSGELRLAARLDYDASARANRAMQSSLVGGDDLADTWPQSAYNLVVVASDEGKPVRLSATASIVVQLVDVNDEEPRITVIDMANRNPSQLEVWENEPRGTFVALVNIQDLDGPNSLNGQFTCTLNTTLFKLVSADSYPAFSSSNLPRGQNPLTYSNEHGSQSVVGAGNAEFQLITAASFDREETRQHFIAIRCRDNGPQTKENQRVEGVVSGGQHVSKSSRFSDLDGRLVLIMGDCPCGCERRRVTYFRRRLPASSLTRKGARDHSQVLVPGSLTYSSLTVAVHCADHDLQVVERATRKDQVACMCPLYTAGVDYVTDCAPPRMTIRGSRHGLFNPFSLPTTDAEYRRSKNNFHVLTNCVDPGFELNRTSTSPMGKWGRFKGSNSELVRWATKHVPEPPQSSFSDGLVCAITLVVNILDKNDNPPRFAVSPLQVSVKEDAPVGSLITTLNATDPDRPEDPQPVTYSLLSVTTISTFPKVYKSAEKMSDEKIEANFLHELISGGSSSSSQNVNNSQFRLEAHTGRLLLKEPLDRETVSEYQLSIRATDRGRQPQSCSLTVHVRVIDINDNAPTFSQPIFRFTIEEEQEAGTVVGIVTATDPDEDENGKVNYRLFGSTAIVQHNFAVNQHTGEITTRMRLDREVNAVYEFFVTAEDSTQAKRLTSTAKVVVEVLDINDNDPKFIYPTQPNHTIHASAYSKVTHKLDSSNGTVSAPTPSPLTGVSPTKCICLKRVCDGCISALRWRPVEWVGDTPPPLATTSGLALPPAPLSCPVTCVLPLHSCECNPFRRLTRPVFNVFVAATITPTFTAALSPAPFPLQPFAPGNPRDQTR
ncbi:unnamed protein product [Schistocephalus solidus]|uniref:Protocadherin-1 n=1 Tax=Schistocephalus solidus TaxID=70667 RepID=A0A183SFG0_SCHSO|nr:unnamed protein product [Schistocephalus solidus]